MSKSIVARYLIIAATAVLLSGCIGTSDYTGSDGNDVCSCKSGDTSTTRTHAPKCKSGGLPEYRHRNHIFNMSGSILGAEIIGNTAYVASSQSCSLYRYGVSERNRLTTIEETDGFEQHKYNICVAAFNVSKRICVTCDTSGVTVVWDLQTESVSSTFKVQPYEIGQLWALSRTKILYTSAGSTALTLVDTAMNSKSRIEAAELDVSVAIFDPFGKEDIYLGGDDGQLGVWEKNSQSRCEPIRVIAVPAAKPKYRGIVDLHLSQSGSVLVLRQSQQLLQLDSNGKTKVISPGRANGGGGRLLTDARAVDEYRDYIIKSDGAYSLLDEWLENGRMSNIRWPSAWPSTSKYLQNGIGIFWYDDVDSVKCGLFDVYQHAVIKQRSNSPFYNNGYEQALLISSGLPSSKLVAYLGEYEIEIYDMCTKMLWNWLPRAADCGRLVDIHIFPDGLLCAVYGTCIEFYDCHGKSKILKWHHDIPSHIVFTCKDSKNPNAGVSVVGTDGIIRFFVGNSRKMRLSDLGREIRWANCTQQGQYLVVCMDGTVLEHDAVKNKYVVLCRISLEATKCIQGDISSAGLISYIDESALCVFDTRSNEVIYRASTVGFVSSFGRRIAYVSEESSGAIKLVSVDSKGCVDKKLLYGFDSPDLTTSDISLDSDTLCLNIEGTESIYWCQ